MALSLTQTTTTGAISASQTSIPVTSATNISAPVSNFYQKIYVIGPGQARGELMNVLAVNGLQVQVSRLDEYKAAYPSGSLVLIGPTPSSNPVFNPFQAYDPPGASASNNSALEGAIAVTPWVNLITGEQWIWSEVLNCWVPGWQNSKTPAVANAVASANGTITPSGPLFHITGALAITGFVRPLGFSFGSFTAIPDAAAASFTWTTGDGSIAVGGQAIQYRPVTFTYDPAAAKWYPSYV